MPAINVCMSARMAGPTSRPKSRRSPTRGFAMPAGTMVKALPRNRRARAASPRRITRRSLRMPNVIAVRAALGSPLIAPGTAACAQASCRGTGRCSGPMPIPIFSITRSGPAAMKRAIGPMPMTTFRRHVLGRTGPAQRICLCRALLGQAQQVRHAAVTRNCAVSPAPVLPPGRSLRSSAKSVSMASRKHCSMMCGRRPRGRRRIQDFVPAGKQLLAHASRPAAGHVGSSRRCAAGGADHQACAGSVLQFAQ